MGKKQTLADNIIAQYFAGYAAQYIPAYELLTPPEKLKHKQAFYFGAGAVLTVLNDDLGAEGSTEADDQQILQSVNHEVRTFANLIATHKQGKTNDG